MENAVRAKSLNEAQMMVWQLVKDIYSEQDLNELRKLLLDFNHQKMQEHLDQTVAEKGYTDADFERILKGHDRKSH